MASTHNPVPMASTGRESVNRGGICGTDEASGTASRYPVPTASFIGYRALRSRILWVVTTATDLRALASDLSLAVVRLTRHLRGRRLDSQVSLTQLSALASLAVAGEMTPGALAARERVQPPSMTRVIASLADLGLVDRKPHPTDGRQIIVSLSKAGSALLADEAAAREVWMTEQLANLGPAQLQTLADAVTIMTAIVEHSE